MRCRKSPLLRKLEKAQLQIRRLMETIIRINVLESTVALAKQALYSNIRDQAKSPQVLLLGLLVLLYTPIQNIPR